MIISLETLHSKEYIIFPRDSLKILSVHISISKNLLKKCFLCIGWVLEVANNVIKRAWEQFENFQIS